MANDKHQIQLQDKVHVVKLSDRTVVIQKKEKEAPPQNNK